MNTTPSKPLPRLIDPRKFAQQGVEIAGSVDINELTRLSESLASTEGSIHTELVFGIGEQRILNVTGSIRAKVQHVCQRCLGPVSIDLDCELSLAIVWSEEKAENLPKRFDPWIIDEGRTDIYAIIEDELLLSLPIVSYHNEECIPYELFSSSDDHVVKAMEAAKKDSNPFQVLEQLKSSTKNGKQDK